MQNRVKNRTIGIVCTIALLATAALVCVLLLPRSGYRVRTRCAQVLNDSLTVESVGSYSGIFAEQGTDTACKNVLTLLVRNTGTQMLQRAELSLGDARFVLTYLPAGAACLVQEQTGRSWSGDSAAPTLVSCEFVSPQALSMHEELVTVSAEPGSITLQNISGADIPGSVSVWYKTLRDGVYFGGISYQAGVDDGVLLAGSSAEITAPHFFGEESSILLVTLSGS